MHLRSGVRLLTSAVVLAWPLQGALAMGADGLDAASGADAGSSRDIIVTATRRADVARQEQQLAPNLINIQSAETIAKYPDVNAAEALSRIPGVALSIDTAEGRFVNIRGLDGNLNGATFGGVVLLNTQPGGTYFNSSGRAVEFDTVPIGAIDRIQVTKTGRPDQDAEGLGGTVELTPRTAIGLKGLFADITLGGGYQPFRGHGLYRDEIVVGGPLGGRNADGDAPFSFVLTQFLYNDRRGFDDLEAAYIDGQPDTPDKAFDALELRRYNYNRKRFGYSGEFDFTPNADHRIYARASLAGYNEHVGRDRLEIDGLGDSVVVDPANPNGFIATGASTVKTLRDEDETHKNLVVQLGGEHHFGDVKFDWFGAYSRATYRKHYDYNTTFAGPADLTVAYDNNTNPDFPTFKVLNGANIVATGNYALDGLNNAVEPDRDREWSGAANLAITPHWAEDDEFKVGGKLRFRRKVSQPLNFTYGYNGPAAGLSGFVGGGPFTDFYDNHYDIGAGIDGQAVRTFLAANPSQFVQNVARDQSRNAGGFFDDSENVYAGYAQYRASFGRLGVMTGVRIEHTRVTYRGNAELTDATGQVSFAPAEKQSSYTNVFPTLQLRYEFQPSLVARATYSTGIARPGFYQTIQSSRVDVGAGSVTTGNPNLRPTYGHNFDLSLEYYLPDSGIISVGLFDKEFRNYIVAQTTRGSFPGIQGIATIDTFQNVSGAYARGIEAAYVNRFRGLPGWLSGFGIDASGSYVDAGIGKSVPLPGAFEYTANGALFYERSGLKLRLSAQYESPVLFGIGGSRATDIFQDKRLTLDFNGSYDLNRTVSFYANLKNLTDEPLRFYEGAKNRPTQREFYGITVEGGVKIHL